MDAGVFAQYVMNGLMLGMMYALGGCRLHAVLGVLDVIKFSHGDVLTVGAFHCTRNLCRAARGSAINSSWFDLVVMLVVATFAMALLGMRSRVIS